MFSMDVFCLADVKTLITLLATASDPSVDRPVAARQRELLHGLQSVLSADAWLWYAGEFHSLFGASDLSSSLLYEGFQDDHDPVEVFQTICRPMVQAAFAPRISSVGADEQQAVAAEKIHVNGNGYDLNAPRVRACDVIAGDHATTLKCRLSSGSYSGVSLLRRQGRPGFTLRERALVDVLFQHVEWLHSAPTEGWLNGRLATLTPREREVMYLLLSGKSRKEVARQLTLSTHTVSDYLKQIYMKLEVSSRAELLANFIPGNR